MVTTMIQDSGPAFVAGLCMTGIFMSLVGAFIIYKSAPYEVKTYKGRRGPLTRRVAIRLFFGVLPFSTAAAVFLQPRLGPGIVFLVLGMGMVPSAILAYLDDQRVSKLEQEISAFIRALGNITSAIGGTVGVGLNNLDRKSMGSLEQFVKRLQFRLNRRLSPDVCWELFCDEAGSELVTQTTRMFVDATKLGGDPEKVGTIAADYALGISQLRAKRSVNASTFAYLTIPLHFAMVSLLVFIMEVISAFDRRLLMILEEVQTDLTSGAGGMSLPALPMFQAKDLSFVMALFLLVMVSLTIVDSFAPRFATGGHAIKTVFFASIMFIETGISILVIPPLVSNVLG
jgi:flagellar protein FlaJ